MSRDPRQRAFAVLWVGQFTATAGLTVVVPLLPFYFAGIGVPEGDVPWWTGVSLAAPAVTAMISAPLWGLVGDRYGRKAMVVRAHAGLALAVALMAAARTPEAFLMCRLLQGACGGVVGATATYASSLAEPQRRGRALGGLFGATAAGAVLGPLFGSVLASQFGYGLLFGVVAGLLVITSVSALVLLKEPAAATRTRGAVGLDMREVAGRLLRVPQGRNLLLAGLAAQAAVFALIVVFASQVERVTGSLAAATVWVGVLHALTWVASSAGAPWWGRRNDRRPAPRGFAVAAACCGIAIALQAVAGSPQALVPLRIAQGFCFAALAQSVLYVVSHLSGERLRGTGIGFATSVLDLGQILGAFFGAAAAALLPPPAAFPAIAALLAVAAVLAVRSDQRSGPGGLAVLSHQTRALVRQ
jgi:MFS transporter, DHA1 family, staphyloferrin B biosynthesis exporter